jgi:hypothetical protein
LLSEGDLRNDPKLSEQCMSLRHADGHITDEFASGSFKNKNPPEIQGSENVVYSLFDVVSGLRRSPSGTE